MVRNSEILQTASRQSRSDSSFGRPILFLLRSTQSASDTIGSLQCLYIVDLLYWGKFLRRSFPPCSEIWYASLIATKQTFCTANLLLLLLLSDNFSFLFDWVLFILDMEKYITYMQLQANAESAIVNCGVDFCIASSKRFYSYKCYICTCCWDFVYIKIRLYILITCNKNQIFP